MLKTNVLI